MRLRPHASRPPRLTSEAPRAASVPWYRQRWLHLALGFVVAVLAVVWAGQRAAQGVRDNLDSRLRDAGAGADAALVSLEAEQLSALRAVTFTVGVGHALATHDVRTLNQLVTPVQANSTVPMVDVILPNGRVEFAVRSKGAPAPVASRAGLPAIAQSIREAHGPRGGRFTEVIIFRSGPVLMTIGPMLDGKKAVGVVLAMTPLADALGRFSQQVAANLTAYDTVGVPIATTATFQPTPVSRDTARSLIGGGAIVTRDMNGDDREALGRLVVDHQPVAVLGVSLPDNSAVTRRAVTLYAALGLIGTVLILGTFWARVSNTRNSR
jgi:hypothetical protein